MLALFLFLTNEEAMIMNEALEHLYQDIFSGSIKPKLYTFYDIIDLAHRLVFILSGSSRSKPD